MIFPSLSVQEEKSLAVNFIEFSFMVMEFLLISYAPSLKPTINFMLSFFLHLSQKREKKWKKYQGKLQFMGDLHSIKLRMEKWDARRIMEFIISSTHSQTLQRKYFSPLSCNARCYNISPFLS